MNYARIYAEFIADRREKEKDLVSTGVYVEQHHILPRSLGGSDDRSNIIDLTADDHLMAHMLLAKIYGRTMWHALRSMMGTHRNKNRVFTTKKIRLAYAMTRENFSRAATGLFDDENYCRQHRAATGIGTKAALNRPDVKERHVEAIRAAHKKRGVKQFSHIKAYRLHIKKIASAEASSIRMKGFYLSGRKMGTQVYNPAQDEALKDRMSASQRSRFKNEPSDQKKARSDAMHTEQAKAKRLETLKSSPKWAAFQERNRKPRPSNSGENHWRAKRKALENATP